MGDWTARAEIYRRKVKGRRTVGGVKSGKRVSEQTLREDVDEKDKEKKAGEAIAIATGRLCAGLSEEEVKRADGDKQKAKMD